MSDWRTRLQPVLADEESAVCGAMVEQSADASDTDARDDDEGDDWVRRRLPVRRVEAIAPVRARMAGAASEAGADEGDPRSAETARRSVGGSFPWTRPRLEASGEGAVGDGDDTDDLTPWQREWLASADEAEPEVTVEEGAVDDAAAEPGWWEGIPAVRQLLLDGLDLGPATVLLGENGSGKSTIVEAIAMAYGLAAEGGSTGSQHHTRATESGLHEQLALVRNGLGGRAGYFLRAETMHSFFSYLEANPTNGPEPRFHELSHGESFVALVEDKFKAKRPGLYVLDEPESALSFENQLRLMRHLQTLMATGRHQILLATHSPILAALPGANILQLDHRGFREVEHDDATLVRQWREFMLDPARFLD